MSPSVYHIHTLRPRDSSVVVDVMLQLAPRDILPGTVDYGPHVESLPPDRVAVNLVEDRRGSGRYLSHRAVEERSPYVLSAWLPEECI
jgi:hypothetical protein